jgi:transcriptional antiterminator RfaH
METAWYCARTKPKHEHIAAANLRKNLELEVFHPRLRVERATQRGVVRVVEPLFPCYLFVRCELAEKLGEIQHTNGIREMVRFGGKIPSVPDAVIGELRECFLMDAAMPVESCFSPGDEVTVVEGVFAEARAFVLRVMPGRKRVQVLLEILGRSMPVEMDYASVVQERSLAEMAPTLAAAGWASARVLV